MANRAKEQSKEDGRVFLRRALIGVELEFKAELQAIVNAVTHDGSQGDATEDAWIKLLRKYLPKRYCAAKAFAIDHEGHTTDQLDCLIYDAHSSTLW